MATYTIVPCAVVGDKCGTWEWRAVASTCRGQLRYEGQQDGVLYVLATVGSGSDPTCGPDMESLRLEATDTLHINLHGTGGSAGVGAVAKWGSGTLQRVIDSAAPTASQ